MNLTIDLSPESTKQPIWYNQYSLLGRLGRTSITKKWGTKCDWKCCTILVYCTYLIRKCIYNHKHFRPKAWIFMGGGCPLKIFSEKAQRRRPRNLPTATAFHKHQRPLQQTMWSSSTPGTSCGLSDAVLVANRTWSPSAPPSPSGRRKIPRTTPDP